MTNEELNTQIAHRLPELMEGWAEIRCFTGATDMWEVIEAMEHRGFCWRINRSVLRDGFVATFNGGSVYESATDTESPGRAVVRAALNALEASTVPVSKSAVMFIDGKRIHGVHDVKIEFSRKP